MAPEKIFVISRKEISRQQTSSRRKVESQDVSYVSYLNWFHILSILAACCVTMSTLTLIPRHNAILDSKYWFEILFPAGVWLIIDTFSRVLDLSVLMEKKSLLSIRFCMKIFLCRFLTLLTCFCVCYVIWTIILEYNSPMPLIGVIGIQCSLVALLVSIILFIPREYMKEEDFKCRLKIFILYESFWMTVVFIIQVVLTRISKKLRGTDAQCIMALLIPMAQQFTNFVLSKLMQRMVVIENEKARVLLTVSVNFSYNLFLAVSFVDARNATMICMAVVEFMIQLNMSHNIVKLNKTVAAIGDEKLITDKKNAVLTLLLDELGEGLVPLAYAIGFSMAFYGPNTELIGNVGNSYWQFSRVDDVNWNFLVLLGLFVIDIICLFLNSSIIWIFSNVNMFNEFCAAMEKYWYIMALKLANNLYIYFLVHDVSCAMDFTREFSWITHHENVSQIANSTLL